MPVTSRWYVRRKYRLNVPDLNQRCLQLGSLVYAAVGIEGESVASILMKRLLRMSQLSTEASESTIGIFG